MSKVEITQWVSIWYTVVIKTLHSELVFYLSDLYTAMPFRNGILTKWMLLKWGHFYEAKPTLKILLASWAFYTVLKGVWTFNAEKLGSVD